MFQRAYYICLWLQDGFAHWTSCEWQRIAVDIIFTKLQENDRCGPNTPYRGLWCLNWNLKEEFIRVSIFFPCLMQVHYFNCNRIVSLCVYSRRVFSVTIETTGTQKNIIFYRLQKFILCRSAIIYISGRKFSPSIDVVSKSINYPTPSLVPPDPHLGMEIRPLVAMSTNWGTFTNEVTD